MTLTVYGDESGTHGDQSPSVIMAGYIGDESQWAAFEKEFRAHLDRFEVDVYHAKELRGSKGPFKGWPLKKKFRFHEGMVRIIDRTLALGFSATLSPGNYKTFYNDGTIPRKLRADTQYGMCFRLCLFFATQYALVNRDKGELNFVLESGARNSADAVRIFDGFKSQLKPEYHGLLGPISFASKRSCPMLAPADMFANVVFKTQSSQNPDAFTGPETHPLDAALMQKLQPHDKDGHIPLVGIPATPDTLRQLREFLRPDVTKQA